MHKFLIEEVSEAGQSMSPEIITNFKRFSLYKNIERDRRENFSFENLEKHILIHCFSQIEKC